MDPCRTLVWNDQPVQPGTFRSSCNGTKITDICYAIKQHQKRDLAGFIYHRYKLVQVMIENGRYQGYNSLVVFPGKPAQLFTRHKLSGDTGFLGQC